MRPARLLLISLSILLTALAAWSLGEKVVEIPTRGQTMRALALLPQKPVASVILFAGGDGDLGLAADGRIGSLLSYNQLVRSRSEYFDESFATLVPDLAPDLKRAGNPRESAKHAQDIGALVKFMRSIATPVVAVGTSRGTLSVANAVANLSGDERPDAMVLTSAFLSGSRESVQHIAGNKPERLAVPTLVLAHRADQCRFTSPRDAERFQRWLSAAEPNVKVLLMEGGQPSTGNPCEANSPHGFLGLDDQVVAAVSQWIKALPK
jgi:hypothetical protein